jgi:hypothetical protein
MNRRFFVLLFLLLAVVGVAPAHAQQIPIIFGSSGRVIRPGWNLLAMSESSAGNGATFTKTGPDDGTFSNCYVYSTITLHGNGSVSWTPLVGANVVGLATSVAGLPGTGYMGINFSLYNEANDGVMDAIELGTPVFGGTYAYGDTLSVQVVGTTVSYYRNGTLFYTSATAATFPMHMVGVSNQHGSSFGNVTLAGAWR